MLWNNIKESNLIVISTLIFSLMLFFSAMSGFFTHCYGCDAYNHGGTLPFEHDQTYTPLWALIMIILIGLIGIVGTIYLLVVKYKKRNHLKKLMERNNTSLDN